MWAIGDSRGFAPLNGVRNEAVAPWLFHVYDGCGSAGESARSLPVCWFASLPYGFPMPTARCLWCTDPPLEEVAVLKWRGTPVAANADEKERLTVSLCRKHLERLRKADPF